MSATLQKLHMVWDIFKPDKRLERARVCVCVCVWNGAILEGLGTHGSSADERRLLDEDECPTMVKEDL